MSKEEYVNDNNDSNNGSYSLKEMNKEYFI